MNIDFPVGMRAQGEGFRAAVRRSWAPWRRRPLGVIGGVLVLFFFLVAVFAALVAPNGPKEFAGQPLEKPSMSFPLGTNQLGQDVLTRTIYGAQISFAVGFAASFMGVFMGGTLGLISGYAGGIADTLISRFLEVLASFPGFILALVLIAALGRPGATDSNLLSIVWQLKTMEFAIAVALIFITTRIVRSAVLTERSRPYIEAARSIGCSPLRIVWRHIAPNVAPVHHCDFHECYWASHCGRSRALLPRIRRGRRHSLMGHRPVVRQPRIFPRSTLVADRPRYSIEPDRPRAELLGRRSTRHSRSTLARGAVDNADPAYPATCFRPLLIVLSPSLHA